VDGADEVSPTLDLVKGWGGALVRERIVAMASARQVIIVGEEKLVQQLGERGRVPIEVRPGALDSVGAGIEALGLVPAIRMDAHGEVFITENGNPIIDASPRASLGDASAVRELERRLLALPGVVDTGLFLATAERVLVGYRDGHVETLVRAPRG
jgi:ribose 5-phosphate isomerase A